MGYNGELILWQRLIIFVKIAKKFKQNIFFKLFISICVRNVAQYVKNVLTHIGSNLQLVRNVAPKC